MVGPQKQLTLLEAVSDLLDDPAKAAGLILAGKARVNGEVVRQAGFKLKKDARLELDYERRYVSRAAHKLLGALEEFGPEVKDRLCVDLGASHGGFTQVLLEAGARRVYAIDVAYGIFDYELRNDSRVILLERHNVRQIQVDWFSTDPDGDQGERIDENGILFTCDVSFISLRSVLPSLVSMIQELKNRLTVPEGEQKQERSKFQGLFLLKPQFEASEKTEQGILKDPVALEQVFEAINDLLERLDVKLLGRAPARLTGTKGNQEYVLFLEF